LLQPAGFSRLGAAVRYSEQLLIDRIRLPNRLLILITDGFSYDQDYEERYAREDTRIALREAQAGGTACVCLSIGGTTSAQQLEEVFGAANLLMVDDAEQWPGRIGPVCRQALQGVRMAKGRRGRQDTALASGAR
jgi:nitric oxide reductase activation protein